ncbi:hypothetical protein [Streptococcus ferus]|uniref:hypothetical protein n=1 Tax=Streptococcus ferus TaxID=1345 RepID=UPI00359F3404
MFRRKKQKAEILHLEQERMALYLINHYEDIHKIEFRSLTEHRKTGTWVSDSVINDEFIIKLTLWGIGGEISLAQLASHNEGKALKKKAMPTTFENHVLKTIQIIYWVKADDIR